MNSLILAIGDITQISATVIVNAANTTLLGGGGVDKAIHIASGRGLKAFNEAQLHYCPPGELRISPALGQLQHNGVQWVFSTVGPIWTGPEHRTDHATTLGRCYHQAFIAAHRLGASSIALPSISTGVYNYPLSEAASIVFWEISLARDRGYTGQIILVAFDEKTLESLRHEARYSHTSYTEAGTPYIGKLND